MNQDTSIAAMSKLGNSLLIGWSTVAKFGFHEDEMDSSLKSCNARERRAKAKRFELMLSEERGKLFSLLLSRRGLSAVRGAFRNQLDKWNDDVVNLVSTITEDTEGVYLTANYLLHYVASGEKTKLGEAIMGSYPLRGVPCGWDDAAGVLYLFRMKIRKIGGHKEVSS